MSNNDVAAHTLPMKLPNPQPLLLHGTTFLTNARQVPDKPYTLVFDAQFSCMHPTTESPQGIGNFRRYLGNTNVDTIPDELYYISVKVRHVLPPSFCHNHPLHSFPPDRNVGSASHSGDTVHLLGEIDTVRLQCPTLFFPLLIAISQITPLAMETEKHLSLIGHPVCVMGCGIVTSSNDTDQSFAIRGSQYVAGRTQEFMVYCRTDINPKWSQDNGQRRFPKAHASIGFAGTVVHFRRYTLANMERTIHTVVVDLQHIACVKERVGMLRPPPRLKTPTCKLS